MVRPENVPEAAGATGTLAGGVLAIVASIQAIVESVDDQTKWTALSAIAVTVAGLIINITTLLVKSRREAEKMARIPSKAAVMAALTLRLSDRWAGLTQLRKNKVQAIIDAEAVRIVEILA